MKYLLALILMFSCLAYAEDDDTIILRSQAVHEGDYYATGGDIEILGRVTGSVYVFGSRIRIKGEVEGDLYASGGTILVGGTVNGNARLAGGEVKVTGEIKENATILGGDVNFSGKVGKTLFLSASNARINGTVNGNVKAYIGGLKIGPDAKLNGLEYSSSTVAKIAEGAQIQGQIEYHPSVFKGVIDGEWKKRIVVGSRYLGLLMNLFFSFVVGAVFIKLFPNRLHSSLAVIAKKPWRAFWSGVLVVILLPIICLLLFITILGFPLALALVALSLVGFYSAKVVPILHFSNRLFPKMGTKKNSLWTFFLGLVIFLALSRIPFLGAFLSMVFIFLGLGSIFLGKIARNRRVRDI